MKEKIKEIELKLKSSAIELNSSKDNLVQKANRISLQKKLNALTGYLSRTNLEHNHTVKIIPALRKIILKATNYPEDKKILSLENFLSCLKNHIEICTELFNVKKESNYTVFELPEHLILKIYLISFLDNDSVKSNYDILDRYKKSQIQEKEGSPTAFKAFINIKDKDGKIVETIKVLNSKNLSFNSLSVSVEFTNDVKYSVDFHKKSIYTYTNKESGKMKRSSVFKPEDSESGLMLTPEQHFIEDSEIIELIEIDLSKDEGEV